MTMLIPCARAEHIRRAFSLIESGATPLAGGTYMLPRVKRSSVNAEHFVDISNVAELRKLDVTAKKVTIGAAVTVDEILANDVIASEFPALAAAAANFGTPQVRARATIGGNIAAAYPSADLAVALATCDAVLTLRNKNGRRDVPLAEFVTSPGCTVLAADELIEAVKFMRVFGGARHGVYLRVGRRRASTESKVTVAVSALVSPGGMIRKIALALGNVGPLVVRPSEVEAMLVGNKFDAGLMRRSGEIAEKAIAPIDADASAREYKRAVTRVLVERALHSMKSSL